MRQVVLIGLVGLLAQFIDGALGMAYGATTATLLLAVGVAPALASTITHLAEVGTTLASGISHHRFGNVDWRAVAWLGLPGGVGALLGAVALSNLDASIARPWMACFLLFVGVYILVRYAVLRGHTVVPRPLRGRFLLPLGLLAGFLDAAGGGGWGPLGTSTLLASRRIEPRRAIGTIDTSEFIVAVCASVGFLFALGWSEVPWGYVIALLVGGVIAAPLAAWLVRKLHPRLLGTAAGGTIALTNLRTALGALGIDGQIAQLILVALVMTWTALLASAAVHVRREFTAAS